MPKRLIDLSIGNYYHIYNRAVAGNLLFIEEKNYWFFLSKIKKYLLSTVDILAYCLMPTHYHLIIKLNALSLPSSMQRLGMSYTAAFNKIYNRSGHLFQGRYQLRYISGLKYLLQSVTYIHLNPFKARLVKKPENWEFSSYLEYIGERPLDFIDPIDILNHFGTGDDPSYIENQIDYRKHIEEIINLTNAPGAFRSSGS